MSCRKETFSAVIPPRVVCVLELLLADVFGLMDAASNAWPKHVQSATERVKDASRRITD